MAQSLLLLGRKLPFRQSLQTYEEVYVTWKHFIKILQLSCSENIMAYEDSVI